MFFWVYFSQSVPLERKLDFISNKSTISKELTVIFQKLMQIILEENLT
jgi:hypothetical protein